MNNEWEGPDGWTPNPDFWRDDSSKEERPKYKKRKLPTIIDFGTPKDEYTKDTHFYLAEGLRGMTDPGKSQDVSPKIFITPKEEWPNEVDDRHATVAHEIAHWKLKHGFIDEPHPVTDDFESIPHWAYYYDLASELQSRLYVDLKGWSRTTRKSGKVDSFLTYLEENFIPVDDSTSSSLYMIGAHNDQMKRLAIGVIENLYKKTDNLLNIRIVRMLKDQVDELYKEFKRN